MKYVSRFFLFYVIPSALASLVSIILFEDTNNIALISLAFVVIPIYYYFLHHKLDIYAFRIILILNILTYALLLICLIVSNGYITHSIWGLFAISQFPFYFTMLFAVLIGDYLSLILFLVLCHMSELIICYCVVKPKIETKKIITVMTCIFLSFCSDAYLFFNSPSHKYKPHDFEYMNGYSSTDLEPFFPYTENNKLVKLKEPSSFVIENPNDMPILDGAEACYPVYAAIANAVYKNIAQIEKEYFETKHDVNGKIVTFYNTAIGYERLFNKEIDMFFGAKPSPSQLELAKDMNIELEYTPIGKEAFVFFVNKDNPIDNISSEDMKKIYHGDITNWNEVGGHNQNIVAFQRPERSGSQSMMLYFMGDVSLKEPLTYEMISGMGGIIEEVAEYYNEDGAIGYTFKYFLEGLNQEDNVKIISIDGVYPTVENIKSGKYPLSTYLYCVTRKDENKENTKKLKEFLLSKQGQDIIEQTGYCGLK